MPWSVVNGTLDGKGTTGGQLLITYQEPNLASIVKAPFGLQIHHADWVIHAVGP